MFLEQNSEKKWKFICKGNSSLQGITSDMNKCSITAGSHNQSFADNMSTPVCQFIYLIYIPYIIKNIKVVITKDNIMKISTQ